MRILILLGSRAALGYSCPMESTAPILFDRARLRKRRARAAATFASHDFLWREAAERAEETLSYILRDFPRMLVFGGQHFTPPKSTIQLIRASTDTIDVEFLPFAENSLDAVVSLLDLHWVNDLPGALAQIRRALKPDGLFYAILPGGETLRELRRVLADTESAMRGGLSPRVAPFLDVRDGGALLQRAGFALPVADSEIIDISYPHLFALMDDLRGAGEVNMLQQQVQHFTPRGFFAAAAQRYAEMFSDEEGRIKATMEFITLTAWKPAATQQKPSPRGSGKVSLKDVLN